MSYIVIPVYDFACDSPGCSCIEDVTPANMGTFRLLDKAHELLRADGWRTVRQRDGWLHYCPQHNQQEP